MYMIDWKLANLCIVFSDLHINSFIIELCVHAEESLRINIFLILLSQLNTVLC